MSAEGKLNGQLVVRNGKSPGDRPRLADSRQTFVADKVASGHLASSRRAI